MARDPSRILRVSVFESRLRCLDGRPGGMARRRVQALFTEPDRRLRNDDRDLGADQGAAFRLRHAWPFLVADEGRARHH